jgi:hypothetical protein
MVTEEIRAQSDPSLPFTAVRFRHVALRFLRIVSPALTKEAANEAGNNKNVDFVLLAAWSI